MVRIHNPVNKSIRSQKGSDNQQHGGVLENMDQISNAIADSVGNAGDSNLNNHDKISDKA